MSTEKKYFDTENKEINDLYNHLKKLNTKLLDLWRLLCEEKFLYQEGAYPAGHGKNHITQVLLNLKKFLDSYSENKIFDNDDKINIFAAAMIHDISLISMRSVGAYGDEANRIRKSHSKVTEIKKQAYTLLRNVNFNKKKSDEIIAIASAHAGDDFDNYSDKMKKLEKLERTTNNFKLLKSAILIQVADFFDIGGDRLTLDVEDHDWKEDQLEHYKKHTIAMVNIVEKEKLINLWLSDEKEIVVNGETFKIMPMERYKVMHMINQQACSAIERLNDIFTGCPKWHVMFDKSIFGEISPIGEGINLFKNTLDTSYEDWKRNEGDEKPFPVDLMGHSLYGRFVIDLDGINDRLKRILQNSMDFRVLILDPDVENQQMCEVYDGQSSNNEDRSILPLYNHLGEIAADENKDIKGDILESLDKLVKWLPDVGLNSSMEVRATTRLMYISINRFGNTLIVTPYRRKGLFNESISLIFKKENSPLFEAYLEVFEDIWKDRFETTIRHFKDNQKSSRNPIKSILLDEEDGGPKNKKLITPFNYEKFFLDKYHRRVKAVFDNILDKNNFIIPPIEVEIQPSEECTLCCAHCIGRHLNDDEGLKGIINNVKLASLLEDWKGDYKIERFRISGLLGDPLSGSGRDVTLGFIKKVKKNDKKREIVLITNGVDMHVDIYPELLDVDYIHISLDAATSGTFNTIKRIDCFNEIITNIKNLRHKIDITNSNTKVGIGFVITPENIHEVDDAINLAKKLNVNFIRFKPDIRGIQPIPWRNWKEARKKIIKRKENEIDIEIVITESGDAHYRVPVVGSCWSQYFYTTVGPDGYIYPCDHLTTCNDVSLGECGDFVTVWQDKSNKGLIGTKNRKCYLCPPLSWRLNRLINQLFHIYKDNGHNWEMIENWIFDALEIR
ncbi:MAG: radical SAM protein [Bacteroidales bacterium]|nr:radical SAM protein [Bacteroidales bacterium]